jgi:hypothetical protein
MGWYDSNWLYRIKVTIDKDKVPANQTDFTVHVDLSDFPSDFFSNVKSDGGDIRVTTDDEETEIPREVVDVNTGAETGELKLKAGSLSSSVDTDVYVYYGNSGASEPAEDATYGRENTWDSGYKLTAHLQETGNGTPGEYLDSTSNDNDGTAGANAPSPVDFIMGKGQRFGGLGADEVITLADSASLDLSGTPFTISFWINFNSFPNTTNYQPFLVNAWVRPAGNDISYLVALNHGQANRKMALLVNDGSTHDVETATTLLVSTDYYVTAVYDGTDLRMYLNGVADGTPTNVGSITINALTKGLTVCNGGTLDRQYDFDGDFDELTIQDVGRDANWILTTYNNQSSPGTFYSVGAQEEEGANGFIPQVMIF